MGLAIELAIGVEMQPIKLGPAHVFGRREDIDSAVFAEFVDAEGCADAEDVYAAGLALPEQPGEIHLQGAGQIKEGGDDQAAFAPFDLADHGA